MSLLINESDFTSIKNRMKEFLGRSGGPFENYNFDTSALSGFIEAAAYLAHYLSFHLNKEIDEIFLDTALLEKSVYSLMKNFNYLPKLKKPASEYLKIRYFRNSITYTRLTMSDTAAFSVGDSLTGSSSAATGTVEDIDISNDYLYVVDVSGTFTTLDTMSGESVTAVLQNTSSATDYNSSDSSKLFEARFNSALYTTNYSIIPTYRDNIQESYYENVDVNDFLDKNIISYSLTPYIDTTTNKRYIQTIIPCYQADWTYTEETIDADFQGKVELVDSNGNSQGDKVILDTIRVYVLEADDSNWYEYKDIRSGVMDLYDRLYDVEYTIDNKVNIIMNIDYISKILEVNDKVRVIYAITQGDDINDEQGSNEYTNDDFETINIFDVTDPLVPISIIESSGYGSVESGTVSRFDSQMVDSSDATTAVLTTLSNGAEKQDLESIKLTAPIAYTTQGRFITEQDYMYGVKSKFTEYQDITAWGGNREFLDIDLVMEEEVYDYTVTYGAPTTTADYTKILRNAQKRYYTDGILTVEDVESDSLDVGKYVRDLGHVYFTMFGSNFSFVGTQNNIDDIKTYLDEKKILTLYFKYMPPTFILLEPVITAKINGAYSKIISRTVVKQKIMDFMQEYTKFNNSIFYYADLENEIESYDEIDKVIEMSLSGTFKVKNADNSSDYIYVRGYTNFNDFTTTISTDGGNLTFAVSSGKVYIEGVEVGIANNNIGIMRFKNNDGTDTRFFTDDYFYIPDVSFNAGRRINSVRDCVIGIEQASDITLVLI